MHRGSSIGRAELVTRVAIIGSGNIGCDVLAKVARSPRLACTLFVGRRVESPGIAFARELGVPTATGGIADLVRESTRFDMVFDATSALAHSRHGPILEAMGKTILNLTPAARGRWCVPAINVGQMSRRTNINMVTCGGQAAAPIAHVLQQTARGIHYIEAVSSISARSAGRATRLNVDEYLNVTEGALRVFSNCQRAKAILNINPADPPVTMQTTVYATLMEGSDHQRISDAVLSVAERVRGYVPGYELLVEPTLDGSRWMTMVRVHGRGDYLPRYAGNLDIITSAAVHVAEAVSEQRPAREMNDVDCLR